MCDAACYSKPPDCGYKNRPTHSFETPQLSTQRGSIVCLHFLDFVVSPLYLESHHPGRLTLDCFFIFVERERAVVLHNLCLVSSFPFKIQFLSAAIPRRWKKCRQNAINQRRLVVFGILAFLAGGNYVQEMFATFLYKTIVYVTNYKKFVCCKV